MRYANFDDLPPPLNPHGLVTTVGQAAIELGCPVAVLADYPLAAITAGISRGFNGSTVEVELDHPTEAGPITITTGQYPAGTIAAATLDTKLAEARSNLDVDDRPRRESPSTFWPAHVSAASHTTFIDIDGQRMPARALPYTDFLIVGVELPDNTIIIASGPARAMSSSPLRLSLASARTSCA